MQSYPLLTQIQINKIAQSFVAGYHDQRQVNPPSAMYNINAMDAVQIRKKFIDLLTSETSKVVGYKIGFTSSNVQQLLNISEPEFGFLIETMNVSSHRMPLELKTYCQTYVEPELAFILGKNLPCKGLTVIDALDATEQIIPAIEIVESRIGFSTGLNDVVCDNVGAGRFILAQDGHLPTDINFDTVNVSIDVDGTTATAKANEVMGHPAQSIVWLANRLCQLNHGTDKLPAGTIIMTGSSTLPLRVMNGSKVIAEFAGLGRLSIEF